MLNHLKNIVRKVLPSEQLLTTDIRMIGVLDIAECGIDDDAAPFVRLKNGHVFYSVLPTDRERGLYQANRPELPPALTEDCFRVALDIIQRYIRENSAGHIPAKTQFLYPDWGFIDLGAHLGYGAMKAAHKVGSAGRVIAVEACPQTLPLLKKNVAANRLENVTVIHAGVTDADGDLEFFTSSRQDNSIHQTMTDDVQGAVKQYEKSETIPGMTVDSILDAVGYPAETINTFMSFEINGAEPDALHGMDRFLTCCPRYDLRIAARYHAAGSASCKEQVMGMLSRYPSINIVPLDPYVFAFKYAD